MIFTTFDWTSVIWSLRRLEGGCGSICCVRKVRPDPLLRPALGPRVIHSGACSFVLVECWSLPKVGWSLVCGSMDASEDNLVLWIEPTSLLWSGLLEAMFPWMTETQWLVWPSWRVRPAIGGAAAPGGSADPRWCGRPCLLAPVHCFHGCFDWSQMIVSIWVVRTPVHGTWHGRSLHRGVR
jgi:hypothetical protein